MAAKSKEAAAMSAEQALLEIEAEEKRSADRRAELLAIVVANSQPAIDDAIQTLKKLYLKGCKDAVIKALKDAGFTSDRAESGGKRTRAKTPDATAEETTKVLKSLTDTFVNVSDIAKKVGLKASIVRNAAAALAVDGKAAYKAAEKGPWGFYKKA